MFIVEDFIENTSKKRKEYPFIRPQLSYLAAISSNFIINLPTFDGSVKDWIQKYISFRNTFVSLLQNNESLLDLQRFHYLQALLKDHTIYTIWSLGISEVNYSVKGLKEFTKSRIFLFMWISRPVVIKNRSLHADQMRYLYEIP